LEGTGGGLTPLDRDTFHFAWQNEWIRNGILAMRRSTMRNRPYKY
jgi:hypothetical protein